MNIWRKPEILIGVAISATFLMSLPRIMQNSAANDRVAQQIFLSNEEQSKLDASLEDKAAKAKVAEQRYQTGCLIVSSINAPGKLTALTNQAPVVDPITKAPLPIGTVVCDAAGNTAELVQGYGGRSVADRFAFTGNRQVINEALRRAGYRVSSAS